MSTDISGVSGTGSVLAALQKASAATGSDFSYLLNTAMRESGLKPDASASGSSASGLFQFVEQTWLGMVKKYGAKYGLGSCAGAICEDRSGHYSVDNAADRQAILNLRQNPEVSALMAGEYAGQCKTQMEASLGRPVGSDELYAAHFLGAEGASKLIRMAENCPGASAAKAFPAAASANPSVFYHADGSAKSASEVYAWTRQDSAPATVVRSRENSGAVTVAQLQDLTASGTNFQRGSGGSALSDAQFKMLASVLLSNGNQDVSNLLSASGQASANSLSLSYDLLRLFSDDSLLANGLKNT